MKNILLIEDDTILRENTAELLELLGYIVFTAPNGKVGIDKANSVLPDIIVCDILMPELDGYGVLNELAKSNKTKFIPFIFLSAKTERQDIRKGMNLGADDYITKPFTESDLINAIESRLAKASILNDERKKKQKIQKDEKANEHEIKTLDELKIFLNSKGEFLKYDKDEIIYKEGQNSNFVYLINKGAVKCYKLDEQGKELTTDLYRENDLFGYSSLTDNISYPETATAITDVELVTILKNDLKNVLNVNHKVLLELIQLMANDLTDLKDQLLQMAYGSVNKKTAKTLLKFAKKLNRKTEDPIIISRNDLASVAGIAPETLIRTMSDFKKLGIIETEGRNIKILNIKKLQEIS